MSMTRIVSMCISAYVRVMGADKWNSLTDEQKHDVIMTECKAMLKALEGA